MKKLLLIAAMIISISQINAKEIDSTINNIVDIETPMQIESWMLQTYCLDIQEEEISLEEVKKIKIENFEESTLEIESWMLDVNHLLDKEAEISIDDVKNIEIELFEDAPIPLEKFMFQPLQTTWDKAAQENEIEIEDFMLKPLN